MDSATRGWLDRQVEAGATAEELDALLLRRAQRLSEEERAALWLYAWPRDHAFRAERTGTGHGQPVRLLKRAPRVASFVTALWTGSR